LDNCLPSCDHIRYVISHNNPTYESTTYNICKAEHIIGTVAFEYSLFSEKLEWTFYSFASGMGGILSIWLGLDFVWFVEWLLKIANWLIAVIFRLSTKKKQAKNLKTIAKSQNIVEPIELQSVS
jgi:hypothetical protein